MLQMDSDVDDDEGVGVRVGQQGGKTQEKDPIWSGAVLKVACKVLGKSSPKKTIEIPLGDINTKDGQYKKKFNKDWLEGHLKGHPELASWIEGANGAIDEVLGIYKKNDASVLSQQSWSKLLIDAAKHKSKQIDLDIIPSFNIPLEAAVDNKSELAHAFGKMKDRVINAVVNPPGAEKGQTNHGLNLLQLKDQTKGFFKKALGLSKDASFNSLMDPSKFTDFGPKLVSDVTKWLDKKASSSESDSDASPIPLKSDFGFKKDSFISNFGDKVRQSMLRSLNPDDSDAKNIEEKAEAMEPFKDDKALRNAEPSELDEALGEDNDLKEEATEENEHMRAEEAKDIDDKMDGESEKPVAAPPTRDHMKIAQEKVKEHAEALAALNEHAGEQAMAAADRAHQSTGENIANVRIEADRADLGAMAERMQNRPQDTSINDDDIQSNKDLQTLVRQDWGLTYGHQLRIGQPEQKANPVRSAFPRQSGTATSRIADYDKLDKYFKNNFDASWNFPTGVESHVSNHYCMSMSASAATSFNKETKSGMFSGALGVTGLGAVAGALSLSSASVHQHEVAECYKKETQTRFEENILFKAGTIFSVPQDKVQITYRAKQAINDLIQAEPSAQNEAIDDFFTEFGSHLALESAMGMYSSHVTSIHMHTEHKKSMMAAMSGYHSGLSATGQVEADVKKVSVSAGGGYASDKTRSNSDREEKEGILENMSADTHRTLIAGKRFNEYKSIDPTYFHEIAKYRDNWAVLARRNYVGVWNIVKPEDLIFVKEGARATALQRLKMAMEVRWVRSFSGLHEFANKEEETKFQQNLSGESVYDPKYKVDPLVFAEYEQHRAELGEVLKAYDTLGGNNPNEFDRVLKESQKKVETAFGAMRDIQQGLTEAIKQCVGMKESSEFPGSGQCGEGICIIKTGGGKSGATKLEVNCICPVGHWETNPGTGAKKRCETHDKLGNPMNGLVPVTAMKQMYARDDGDMFRKDFDKLSNAPLWKTSSTAMAMWHSNDAGDNNPRCKQYERHINNGQLMYVEQTGGVLGCRGPNDSYVGPVTKFLAPGEVYDDNIKEAKEGTTEQLWHLKAHSYFQNQARSVGMCKFGDSQGNTHAYIGYWQNGKWRGEGVLLFNDGRFAAGT